MSYPILYTNTEYKHTSAIAGVAVSGLSIVGDSTEVTDPFDSLGLGTLVDAVSCTVTEERNGAYELQMTYPLNGVHFEDIRQRYFIMAKPNYLDDPQPFRVYKISKPLDGLCTIYARHISYDLSGFEIEGGLTAQNASLALNLLNQRGRGFTIGGQVTGSAEFKTDVPASIRSWFGGKQGSLIDLYGGEWKYDFFSCQLMANRGADRGVTIRYGKNLTTLTQDEACANVYSHVRAYWQKANDDSLYISDLVGTGMTLYPERIFFLDCSNDFTDPPSVADLNARAISYIRANNLNKPSVNLTLNFVQLRSAFDRVDLCDIVTVVFEELGVDAKAKCIKTKWNVLTDRYDEITLGDAKSSFASTVSDLSVKATGDEIKKNNNTLVAAIEEATEMITGNLGGYVVLHDSDEDGYPDEILIMDEPNIEDAVKIWRWNKAGLGYSSTGYNGTFGLAMTADGSIVADYITTGLMTANRIRGGTLTLGGINNEYGVLQILDEDGNVIGLWDRSGAMISGDVEMISNKTVCKIGVADDTDGRSVYGITMNPTPDSSNYGNTYINFAISQDISDASGIRMKNYHSGSGVYDGILMLKSIQVGNNDSVYSLGMSHNQHQLKIFSGVGSNPTPDVGGQDYMQLEVSPTRVGIGNTKMSSFISTYAATARGFYMNSVAVGTNFPIRLRMQAARYIYADFLANNIEMYAAQYVYLNLTNAHFRANLTSNTYMIFSTAGIRVTINGTSYTVAYQGSSSKRYKHDIAELGSELDPHKLLELKPKQFVFNDDAPLQYDDMKDRTLPGFIAEEVEEIYPSAVIHKDGEVENWDERRMIPPMLALIQEQAKKIEELEKRIEDLERRLI